MATPFDALLIGSMGLTFGVIGAAQSGARRGTGPMALLVLPLAVPLLIFGTLAPARRSWHHQSASNAFGRRFCAAFGPGTAGSGKRLGNWRNRDRSLRTDNCNHSAIEHLFSNGKTVYISPICLIILQIRHVSCAMQTGYFCRW